jgi:hypothetical protein
MRRVAELESLGGSNAMCSSRFVALLASFLLVGCDSKPPSRSAIHISNVTKTNELTLLSTNFSWLPSSIALYLTGHVDGTAYMTFTERSERLPLSGDVAWAVSYDFFRTSGVFGYYPVSVRGGHLTLQYLYR